LTIAFARQANNSDFASNRDDEPNASGLDGLRSVQVTEAVIQSAREGRLVEVARE
jgi:hypothetical protein